VRRRETWALGRLLSKQLILEDFGNLADDPRTIEIRSHDVDGRAVRPQVRIDGRLEPWCLSIAHSERSVLVALATEPGIAVGVDLVVVEPHGPGLLNTWFTREERDWIGPTDFQTISTVWAVKEAVYKAQNSGQGFAPLRIAVRRQPSGRYTCTYHGIDLDDVCDIQVEQMDGQTAVVATIASGRLSQVF
jgi:phosphopantetheinyl transferase